MPRTLLYYDARCAFCLTTVRWLRRLDFFRRLDCRASQDQLANQAGLNQFDLGQAAVLLSPSGGTYHGFYAFRQLALLLPLLWPLAPLLWLPGAACVGVRLYRWVAGHRGAISRRIF